MGTIVKVQNSYFFFVDSLSQGGDYKDLSHLLCDAVLSGTTSLTFLRNVVPSCLELTKDNSSKSDVWLTVHRNSVWIRKTN